jgi:HlyD family secretion protein
VPDRTDATSSAEHPSNGSIPGAESFPKPRRTLEKRPSWIPWLVIVVVVVAIGGTVWLTTGSSGPAYRFAMVTTGSPVQTLDSVGTLTPVNQANLNFGTSGTVASVAVTVGQVVNAGQELATLDTTSLQSAVLSAQATMTSAQAKLTSDQNNQPSSSVGTGGTTTTTALQSRSVSDPGSGNVAAVTQAQSTLVADQKQADADQGQATADLRQAVATCDAPTVTTTTMDPPPTSATPDSAPPPTSTSTSTSTTTPAQPPSTACMNALQLVATDQNTVSQDQATVATDEATLATTVGSTASGAAKPTGSASGSAATGSIGSGASASGNSGSTQSGGSSGATTAVTPQQLASDQAALDVAVAGLTAAQQDLADANLLSPIAGTVASVAITPGGAVSAGSSVGPSANASIVILGPGSFVVSANIAVANIAGVMVGQKAIITPDATTKTVTGTVTSIGLVASTSSAVTTYPVTVAMADDSGMQLLSGAAADVNIVTKGATDVTSVPSSAVQTVGANHFVTEYRNGSTSLVRVTLGTVGDILTQVSSGVKPGTTIVLADLNLPIPASSATTTGRRTFGAGGGLTGGAGGGLTGGARGG